MSSASENKSHFNKNKPLKSKRRKSSAVGATEQAAGGGENDGFYQEVWVFTELGTCLHLQAASMSINLYTKPIQLTCRRWRDNEGIQFNLIFG